MHRFVQHAGRMSISTVVLGELHVWAHRRPNPQKLITSIDRDILQNVAVLDYNAECAREYGRIRGLLLRRGNSGNELDLMIAAVALVNDLTLVTNNTADFANVPDLRIVDWLVP